MTYQDTSDIYKDQTWRNRAEMCIREKAFTFTSSDKADVAALANGVIASNWVDIESIMAAVVSTENAEATVADDNALATVVVVVWETVAKARYAALVGMTSSELYGNTPRAVSMRPPTVVPGTVRP